MTSELLLLLAVLIFILISVGVFLKSLFAPKKRSLSDQSIGKQYLKEQQLAQIWEDIPKAKLLKETNEISLNGVKKTIVWPEVKENDGLKFLKFKTEHGPESIISQNSEKLKSRLSGLFDIKVSDLVKDKVDNNIYWLIEESNEFGLKSNYDLTCTEFKIQSLNQLTEPFLNIRLSEFPHIAIVGASNSGKTTTAIAILSQLIINYFRNPNVKRSEQIDEIYFGCGKGQADFISLAMKVSSLPVAHPFDGSSVQIEFVLKRAWEEYERRTKILNSLNCKFPEQESFGRYILVIDELAAWNQLGLRDKDGSQILDKLMGQARSAGIHIILLSQEYRAATFPVLTKANISLVFVHRVEQSDLDYLKTVKRSPEKRKFTLAGENFKFHSRFKQIEINPDMFIELRVDPNDVVLNVPDYQVEKLQFNNYFQDAVVPEVRSVLMAIESEVLLPNKLEYNKFGLNQLFQIKHNQIAIAVGDLNTISSKENLIKMLDLLECETGFFFNLKVSKKVLEFSDPRLQILNVDDFLPLLNFSLSSLSKTLNLQSFDRLEESTLSEVQDSRPMTLSLDYYDYVVSMKNNEKKGSLFEMLLVELLKAKGKTATTTHDLLNRYPRHKTPSSKQYDNGSDWGIDVISSPNPINEGHSNELEIVQCKCFSNPSYLKPDIVDRLTGSIHNYKWLLEDQEKIGSQIKAIWTPVITNSQALQSAKNQNIQIWDRLWFIKEIRDLKNAEKTKTDDELKKLSVRAIQTQFKVSTAKASEAAKLFKTGKIEEAKKILEKN